MSGRYFSTCDSIPSAHTVNAVWNKLSQFVKIKLLFPYEQNLAAEYIFIHTNLSFFLSPDLMSLIFSQISTSSSYRS